jgi:hypothetical protein
LVNLSGLELGRLLLHFFDLTRYFSASFLGILDLQFQVFKIVFILASFLLHLNKFVVKSGILLALVTLGLVKQFPEILELLLGCTVRISGLSELLVQFLEHLIGLTEPCLNLSISQLLHCPL